MYLITYSIIGCFIHSFLREVVFNSESSLPILNYFNRQGITPDELELRLFMVSILWPTLIFQILNNYKR